jgi:hypothetical protein
MYAIIGIKLGFGLFLLPLVLLAFVFWLWMLVHAITNRGVGEGEKIAWVLVILFLHFLGALIYFIVGRPKGMTSRPI